MERSGNTYAPMLICANLIPQVADLCSQRAGSAAVHDSQSGMDLSVCRPD